jgi:AcrR family transcriptional regulator
VPFERTQSATTPQPGSKSERSGGAEARPALSRALIAEAALQLVDDDGLEALTMRRLAAELGVGTMTLYGYFRDKGELLDFAVECASRRYELPAGEGEWRPRLRELIMTMMRSVSEHPSLVQIRAGKPILNPGALRACEAGMTIMTEAGFETRDAAAAWRLLFTYVFGYGAFSAYEPSRELKSEWSRELAALPEDEYPITSREAEELAEWMAGPRPFEQGLDLILDGLEARLSTVRSERDGRKR